MEQHLSAVTVETSETDNTLHSLFLELADDTLLSIGRDRYCLNHQNVPWELSVSFKGLATLAVERVAVIAGSVIVELSAPLSPNFDVRRFIIDLPSTPTAEQEVRAALRQLRMHGAESIDANV